jgi:processive 1,2-diacylglycerol beta-glucosyltransferase
MNVLIFSVSIGNGHDQAAHTLRNEFIRYDNSSRVKVINTINFISPILDKVILDSYLNILKVYPKAWGKIYQKTNKLDPMIDVNDIANRLITGKLKSTTINFKPDVIICTHSFPSAIISKLKQKNKVTCPLVSVVTDFNIHSSYINEATDYYIIPHEDLTYIMDEFGVDSGKILPFGIPVRSEFSEVLSDSNITDKLGLDNKSTILVMGGGLGLGQISDIVKAIDSYMTDVQIIAVAGRNNRLEARLKNLNTRNKLIVYGFINNIYELMEIADCIVTKPGGVTTAEILCKQKPLIIFSPLPGQEYENAEFLLNSGAAVTTSEVNKIPVLIKSILNSPTRIRCLKDMMGILKKPYATTNIVKFLAKKI